MINMKRSLLVVLVVVLSLIAFVDFGYSQSSLLPWVRFNGTYQVTAGVGTGALTLNASVFEMDYENGDVWRATNVDLAVESILGAKVVLSGATRTGDYSFNGDPANPDDVKFSVIASDGFVYFDANLSDSVFTQSGSFFVWLNQYLNPSDPTTLNLYNIVLNTDASHPSRYIQELATYLSASNVSGLKMQLRVPTSTNGTFTTNGTGTISFGLIDGLQSLNTSPVANAGENMAISSEEIAITTIQGTATDADGDALQCRWMWTEGTSVLLDWTSVGGSGECPLDLSTLVFGVGTYTLTLQVDDGQSISSDDMILTIDNSAPHAAPGGGGVYEINTDVVLTGDISDFDGDLLQYEWTGSGVICSGNIQAIAGGYPVIPPDCVLSNLSLGTHTFTLQADDGWNLPDRNDITVEIIDTTVPTIAPLASNYILWPPNHVMVDIRIQANASDNSGLPVTLSAMVSSNEPEDGLGDGDTGPDWIVPVINEDGTIDLQLRRERSGSGNGRVYTVSITATDSAGNSSTVDVPFSVPHDMRNKK